MRTLLALVLLFYLPGALLLRVPVADQARRGGLPAVERLFWAVTLSTAWSLSATLALAAASLYRFEWLLGINGLCGATLLAVFRLHLRWDRRVAWPRADAAVAIGLALLVWRLAMPPAEYVMGGKDPGTYMNEGIQIAQRGSLVIRDPVVAAVPPATRDLFFPSHGSAAYYSVRFMGFFLHDPEQGTIVGQFPHLFPASIALGYGVNGLSGARQAVSAWAALMVVAVFLAAARLFGVPAAAAGAALLSINVIHVWFARYPNAEMATGALLFAALLAFARATIDGDRFFAPVAAWLLVLLLFVRIDAALAWAACVTALGLGRLTGLRAGGLFWAVLLAGAALAGWYYTSLMTGYLAVPALFVRETVPVAALAAGVAMALLGWWAVTRVERLAAWLRAAIPWAVALTLVALAAYAWLLREAGGRTAWHDAAALRTFLWYTGAVPFALALLGVLAALPRLFWRDPAFFLTGAAFATFFFYKIRIVPEHFWMTRRFLPVVLPMVAVLMAAAAWWVASPEGLQATARRTWNRGRRDATMPAAGTRPSGHAETGWRRVASGTIALLLLLPIGWQWWSQSRPVLPHVEYAGLIARLEQLAGRLGDEDLLLVESRNASDLHVFALPLAYIYARPVLVLNSPRPDRRLMETFIADARSKYREVFFLGSGGTDLLTRRIGVAPVASDRFQVPEYESPVNAYPRGVRQKEFDYGIYRFVDTPALVTQPVLVIGERDDLQVVRFHAKERDPRSGATYRWTRDVSYVSLLNVTPATRAITLWMANGRRPATLPAAVVEVSLEDVMLGTVEVGPDPAPYSVSVPATLAATLAAAEDPARLRLRATTWRPRAAIGTPDDRDLGVMVYRVETR